MAISKKFKSYVDRVIERYNIDSLDDIRALTKHLPLLHKYVRSVADDFAPYNKEAELDLDKGLTDFFYYVFMDGALMMLRQIYYSYTDKEEGDFEEACQKWDVWANEHMKKFCKERGIELKVFQEQFPYVD